jgi:GMP synthase (glutamine-hydrolysing)
MKIHYLQHVAFEGLGCIATWAKQAGHPVSVTRLYRNEALPSPHDLDFLVVLGGPMNVYEEHIYPWLRDEKRFIAEVLAFDVPMLGICLGAQLMALVLGARVYANDQPEIGWFPVFKSAAAGQTRLDDILPEQLDVLHWHGDTFELPRGAIQLASSKACEQQGFVLNNRAVGLQFHLETTADSLSQLIDHCRDEIGKGPYMQSPGEMMAYPQRFDIINKQMTALLEALTKSEDI